MPARGGTPRQVAAIGSRPAWSPDGRRIVFLLDRGPGFDVGVANADGSGLRMLTDDAPWESDARWSPDGTSIAVRTARAGNFDVGVIDVATGGMRILTLPENNDVLIDWLPDGSAIVSASGDYSHKLVTVRVDKLLVGAK
jgi:TolB protein